MHEQIRHEQSDGSAESPEKWLRSFEEQCESNNTEGKPKVFVELMCGAARLTAACAKRGFRAFGIDWKRNKSSKPHGHCLMIDLTVPANQRFVLGLILAGQVAGLHAAPPCGTATRARDKPLNADARAAGLKRPMPLRSGKWPRGFPTLRGQDKERVDSANVLYDFVVSAAEACSSMNVPWSIENPENSYFWQIPEVVGLLKLPQARDIAYDACMHGGERLKKQRLRANFAELEEIGLRCDGSHTHLDWSFKTGKGFATAAEAEYTPILCARMAECFQRAANARGWSIFPAAQASKHRSAQIATAVARQPKRSRIGQLIPEFEKVLETTTALTVAPGEKFASDITIDGSFVPKGSKRLKISSGVEQSAASGPETKSVIGIYRDQHSFFEEAKSVRHPALLQPIIEDDLGTAVVALLKLGPRALKAKRLDTLSLYRSAQKRLQQREDQLHQSMPAEVRRVMEGKNVLLFKQMIQDAGLADERVAHYLSTGFPMSGEFPETGLFPKQVREAAIQKEELWRTAKYAQDKVSELTKASRDSVLDQKVWAMTLEEKERGWIDGPFSKEEVSLRVGRLWVPSRRFGLQQGEKTRLIDDVSEFQTNGTVRLQEKLELGGIDEVIMVARVLQECLCGLCTVVKTTSGAELPVLVHPDWNGSKLLGRTLDLASAYKQLAIRPSDKDVAVLAVFSPEDSEAKFFVANALAFGSTASVMAFNWMAVLIRKVMIRLFLVITTSYFDDYPTLEFDKTAESGQTIFEDVLRLLGWKFAEEPKKRKPFAEVFRALGANIDMSRAAEFVFEVGNTAERLEAILEEFRLILGRKSMRPQEAASMRGKFGYAYGLFCGRPLAAPLRQLSNRAEQIGGSPVIHSKLHEAICMLMNFLRHEKPRKISFKAGQQTVFMETDGSFENGRAECGAVLQLPGSAHPSFFGHKVPDDVVEHWRLLGSTHAIAQAELWPVALALHTWPEELRGAFVVLYVDNNAVLDSLIKGNTGCLASLDLLSHVCLQIMRLDLVVWVTRVPSQSNLSDGPSRGDYANVLKLGGVEVCAKVPQELLPAVA